MIEFATLGCGNHFIELQADEDGRLWLMVHSGSRALGQAIRDRHLARAQPVGNRLRALDAKSSAGADFLHDVSYARHFADASRRAERELRRQMAGVWYDSRISEKLRDEAPSAYKDISAVLELVKVTRTLRPVPNYKGGVSILKSLSARSPTEPRNLPRAAASFSASNGC